MFAFLKLNTILANSILLKIKLKEIYEIKFY